MTSLTERLRALAEFDDHTAERQADADYGEGGWLSNKGIAFADGARYQRAQLKPLLDALIECAETLKAEYPCDEHDMEPNTTMDFFRCDRCGIRPSLAEALSRLEGLMK